MGKSLLQRVVLNICYKNVLNVVSANKCSVKMFIIEIITETLVSNMVIASIESDL